MLILYVRLGCHLCDEALYLLAEMHLPVTRVNIDRDPELQTQYNLTVPVLYDPARDAELPYPFDYDAVKTFLARP